MTASANVGRSQNVVLSLRVLLVKKNPVHAYDVAAMVYRERNCWLRCTRVQRLGSLAATGCFARELINNAQSRRVAPATRQRPACATKFAQR